MSKNTHDKKPAFKRVCDMVFLTKASEMVRLFQHVKRLEVLRTAYNSNTCTDALKTYKERREIEARKNG